jgi:hypothetical protein
MRHVKAIGRLGVLAVGLGIGAAVSSTGTASADGMQISIDGFDLFPTAGNTATATSGMGDIAIAIGNHSSADAEGGIGDIAYANGSGTSDLTGSHAIAGDPTVGATGNNYDFAYAVGNLSQADAEGGSFDSSSANGFGTFAFTGGGGSNFDVANVSGANSVAEAGHGSYDYASVMGNFDTAHSGFNGSVDSATIFGNNSTANAEIGSGDQAFVFDLFAGRAPLGSDAFAGGAETPGNFDLAGVIGDGLIQHSIGDFITHIAPYF